MTNPDQTTSEIRKALDREVERRFDAVAHRLPPLAQAHASEADPAGLIAPGRSPGPFGRVPVAIQWAAIAAAFLGAALGIRSLWIDRARPEAPTAPQAGPAAQPAIPPGADAALPDPSAAPAPPLHDAATPPQTPNKRRVRPAREPESEWVAESAPAQDPLASQDSEGAPEAQLSDTNVSGVVSGTRVSTRPPAAKEPKTPPPIPNVVASVPGGASVSAGTDLSEAGVRVLSARVAGRPVQAQIVDAPDLGATLVLLPPVASLSAIQQEAPIQLASLAADREPRGRGRVLAPKDDSLPADEPGPDEPSDVPGAYYVRLFLGSFDPMTRRSQGVMGQDMQVIPLREDEIWGDNEQERSLARIFELSSIVAVDGARVEPDADDLVAESSFVAGVSGHLFGVYVQASPTETDDVHRIELRLRRAEDQQDEPPLDSSVILSTTLLVENGRVIILGIPEPHDSVHGSRGPRVAFLAVSPRFGSFEPAQDAEEIHYVEGDVEAPVLVERTRPRYSPEALARRAEGKVVLQAVIRKDGQVDGVQVLRVPDVPGGDYLVEAAARAVREWRYLPAKKNGEPVNAYFTVVIHFTLRQDDGT